MITRVQSGESLLQARKRLDQAIQARHAQAQQAPGRPHVAHGTDDLLTMREGALLARFDVTAAADPTEAFRKWVRRRALPVLRRGRVLLIRRCVVLAALVG